MKMHSTTVRKATVLSGEQLADVPWVRTWNIAGAPVGREAIGRQIAEQLTIRIEEITS